MIHVQKRALCAFKKDVLPGPGRFIKILGRVEREIKEPRAIFLEMGEDLLERERMGLMHLAQEFIALFQDILEPVPEIGKRFEVPDPHADARELLHDHGLTLGEVSPAAPVDALVVAVAHREFRALTPADLRTLVRGERPVLADVKSLYDPAQLQAAGFTVFRL